MDAVIQGWFSSSPLLVKGLLQMSILIGIIYFVYRRFIQRSQAAQLLKGLFVILLMMVGLWGIFRLLDFKMLETVFGAGIQLLFIGLIVIFQPELRRILMYLGQGEIFGLNLFANINEEQRAEFMVHELAEAVHFLSKSKRGALIVLESPSTHGGDYLEVGTRMDAKLSTELLLTIFHPNTPLHDGAVVISQENRISAAGVLLPLTEDPKLSWQYGTRHRAAIGLTEISDSRCIVISEETGSISLVKDGKLEKVASADELRRTLGKIYHVSVEEEEARQRIKRGRIGEFFSVNTLPDSIQRIFQRGRAESTTSGSSEKHPKSGT